MLIEFLHVSIWKVVVILLPKIGLLLINIITALLLIASMLSPTIGNTLVVYSCYSIVV